MKLTTRHIILLFVLSLALVKLPAQNNENVPERICYTDYMMEKNADKFPKFDPQKLRASATNFKDEFAIIPVVVHIIHNNGPENISDERIRSQVEALNEDFGHYGIYNNDDRGEDTKIRFCLATKDPDGNPTNGIVRVASPYTDLDSDKEMLTKNLSRWDPHLYLNIWVVKSIDGSENIQGYSYVPRTSGGPSFNADGVVITYKFFGKIGTSPYGYNLGRTTTHEVGHYLDLIHPWGGDDFYSGQGGCNDDDGIGDTPNCDSVYFSIYPQCNNPRQCNHFRMIENFMDYSTDGCMSLFTPGQGDKMRATLKTYRSKLISYNNIVERGCVEYYDSLNNNTTVDVYPNPIPLSDPNLYFTTHSKEKHDLTIYLYDFSGNFLFSHVYKGVDKKEIILNLKGIRPGMYFLIGYYADRSFQHKIIIGHIFDN